MLFSSSTRQSSLRFLFVADQNASLVGRLLRATTTCRTSPPAAVRIPPITRSYVTRAHPKAVPIYPIIEALQLVMDNAAQRLEKRQQKERIYNERLERNKEHPPTEGKYVGKVMPPWKRGNPDETIELALNLNLDPRKPGQSLRGSVTLPHGTGRKIGNCVVFTEDPEAQERARQAGAYLAGGEALVDQIVAGDVPVNALQFSVGTPEIMPMLNKKAARLLGPRKLMPNVKVGTLVETTDELVAAVEALVTGKEVMYRTETDGIVHVPVGKHSIGLEKILENLGAVLQEIFKVRPEQYGKGKQKKAAKKGQTLKKTQSQYLLRAHVSSTQSPGFRVDLRTVDPNSPFFLSSLDPHTPVAPVVTTPTTMAA